MNKNKILALFLTLAVLGLMSSAKAQFTYAVTNGAVTITGYTGPGGAVTVPDTINNEPVTGIGDNTFFDTTSVTSVTIGTNVTSIGAGAFEYCLSLTNITVTASNPAYMSTNGIVFNHDQTVLVQFPEDLGGNYVIPNSVTNIGDDAFFGCTSLTNITIPDNVTSIGEGAFALCVSLPSVIIPDSIVSLGNEAFVAGFNLTNVTIGTNVTNLGTNVFDGCFNLTNIIIPASVTNIGFQAFYQCGSLTSITIGSGVTSIGSQAFMFCTNLASITIPNNVTSIGELVFFDLPSLSNVTLGNGVTNIGDLAFDRCPRLTNITVVAGNPDYSSINGVLFNQNQTSLIQFPGGLGGSYTIPNGVTSIEEQSFTYGARLTRVIIPNSVTNIGLEAFLFCTNLTNLTFLGNAPLLANISEFTGDVVSATVYYYYGTSGWGATYGGLPTVGLFMPPQISGSGGNIGVASGNFSFTVTGVSNQTIVVEASTNLVNWQPVWTNTLSGAATNFADPQWKNYPSRFYRAQ